MTVTGGPSGHYSVPTPYPRKYPSRSIGLALPLAWRLADASRSMQLSLDIDNDVGEMTSTIRARRGRDRSSRNATRKWCPRFPSPAFSRNLAWVLGPFLLLVAASTATADTAVVGLSPKVARPGERVDLRIACGACPADATFPISLVPVAKAPKPYPCRDNTLCIRTAAAPPRQRPFLFLGSTSGARARAPAVQPPGSDSQLGFDAPMIEPGVYAFVIFAVSRRGTRGSLIADTGPGDLLRILPSEAPMGSKGGDSDETLWIVAGLGTIALAVATVLLLRRRTE